MSKLDDGGPVVPHLMAHCQVFHETEMYPGMTLRQWYKGMCAVGMLSRSGEPWPTAQEIGEMADALIAEDKESEK